MINKNKYSLNKDALVAQADENIKVLFLDKDDFYQFKGFVGSVVKVAPEGLTLSEIIEKTKDEKPDGVDVTSEKYQEILDALVKIDVFVIQD